MIIELSGSGLNRLGEGFPKPFEKVKTLELLHFLNCSTEEIAAIFRLEFQDSSSKVNDLVGGNIIEIQVLEKERDRVFVIFIRGKPILSHTVFDLTGTGGYLFSPLELKDGKIKLTFLGSIKQIKNFLKIIESKGIHHKILSLMDAEFSPNSPLSRLTEKQRLILAMAYNLGYYDIPKKIDSRGLASRLNLNDSTVVEHLKKAEHRLLSQLFS
jgi:predicted DNA binding protein